MNLILLTVLTFGTLASFAFEIEVQGHRGARGNRPENTMPAFEFAIEAGVDVLEMDLGVTKDEQLVISHDRKINPDRCQWDDGRPLKKSILIHKMTLAQIKLLDCGSQKNPDYPEQVILPHTPMPTLDEVFERFKDVKTKSGKPVKFNIETKISFWAPFDTVNPRRFANLVMAKIYQYQMLDRVILQSFDYRTLKEARKITPCIKISALSQNPFENYSHTVKSLKAEYMSPLWKFISSKEIEEIHKAGGKVIPWTPNNADQWQLMLDMGVDGLITDYPKDLINYLDHHERF